MQSRKWEETWADSFLTLTRILTVFLFPFIPSFSTPPILLEAGIIAANFMLRRNLFYLFSVFILFYVITSVCLNNQVKVIKYSKANGIFLQVSSLEIFHQGTFLVFPNVVMNFKVDLYYWGREVCDQNTELSPDWIFLFLECWKGVCSCQQERIKNILKKGKKMGFVWVDDKCT